MKLALWSSMKASISEVTTPLMKGSNCLMCFGANVLLTAFRNRTCSFPLLSIAVGTRGYPLLSSANVAGKNFITGRKVSFDEKMSGWFKTVCTSSYLVTTQVSSSGLRHGSNGGGKNLTV